MEAGKFRDNFVACDKVLLGTQKTLRGMGTMDTPLYPRPT